MKLNQKLIKKAVSGDAESINKIVSIYQPYINTLTTMTLCDYEGNSYSGINVEFQNRLTTKLIQLICTYKCV